MFVYVTKRQPDTGTERATGDVWRSEDSLGELGPRHLLLCGFWDGIRVNRLMWPVSSHIPTGLKTMVLF